MRFLMFVLGLSVVCAIIYFTFLFWGKGRPIHSFDHSFDLKGKPYVILPWDSEMASTPENPRWSELQSKLKNKGGTLALWIDVYRDQSGSLKALPSQFRPAPLGKLHPEVKDQGVLLSEVIKKWGNGPYVLNVHSNVENIDIQLTKEFESLPQAKALVQSEYDNVMLSTKTIRPLWSYGTSASDRMRWMTYGSLGLIEAVNFKGDVYLSPLSVRSLPAIDSKIVTEVHRRQQSVILGPLNTAADAEVALALDADGYFVTSEEALAALKIF